MEVRRVDDRDLRNMLTDLVAISDVDEHRPREQAVPRRLGDDPHRDPVAGMVADVAVLDEDVLALHVGQ